MKFFARTVGSEAACVPVRRLWPPGWSDFVGVLVCGRARGLTGSQRPGLEKMGLGPGAPAVPAAGAGGRPQEGSAPAPRGCSLSAFFPSVPHAWAEGSRGRAESGGLIEVTWPFLPRCRGSLGVTASGGKVVPKEIESAFSRKRDGGDGDTERYPWFTVRLREARPCLGCRSPWQTL